MKQYFLQTLALLLCPILIYAQESSGKENNELRKSVYFAPAQYDLAEDQSINIQDFLKKLPNNINAYGILLVGHTDNVGNEDYNKRLSQQRCKMVKDYLLTQGISISQLAYEGKGYHNPVATNETLEGKAKNRRVEIILVPKGSISDAPLQVPKEKIVFDASKGVTYTYERSGTEIRIPADALVYADGTPVKGEVEVNYREFRDAADFISTDIPMMFDNQHQFESAGMFEMTAFQDGRELFVKDSSYVDVEFMMTSDSVSDVSFFEYEDNQWKTLGRLDRRSQENTFDVNTPPCKARYRYRMPSLKGKDTLTVFKNAMRTGYYLAKEKGFEQFYRIGFTKLEERFHDVRYAGTEYLHYKISKIDWKNIERKSRRYMPIDFSYNENCVQIDPLLKQVKLPEGLWMEFGSVGETQFNAFPEMRDLIRRTWIVLKKGKHNSYDRSVVLRTLSERYMDIRVSYLGSEQFQFVLKGINGLDTLVATPDFKKSERKNSAEICDLLIENYNEKLAKRTKRFDERMDFYEKNWKYFLAFSKSIMPLPEQCKSINGWVKHFANNPQLMKERYYGYAGLDENAPDLSSYMGRAVAGTPVRIDNAPLPPNRQLAQRLSLNGFGVFNCDALQRLGKERVTVAVSFMDDNGDLIDAKTINVIDYEINSVLRLYDGTSVSFNPKRKHTFVITDFFGDIYVVNSNEISKHQYKSGIGKRNKSYVLNAVNLEANSVEALRDAIAMN